MIDNVTLELSVSPPSKFFTSKQKPFIHLNQKYTPRYDKSGDFIGYQSRFRNLVLNVYETKSRVINSIHKYYHGNNWGDFSLPEIYKAIEKLNAETGQDWMKARVKQVEYGCNISANAHLITESLKGYKHKCYQAMVSNGVKYGVFTEVEDYYRIKGYDKAIEVKKTQRLNVGDSIFRWEIAAKQKHLCRVLGTIITLEELLKIENMMKLALDAINKYEKSMKSHPISLKNLKVHDQNIYASMENPLVSANLKTHHKETYKKYRRIYKKLLAETPKCDCAELIREKLIGLINNFPACSIPEKGVQPTPTRIKVNGVGKGLSRLSPIHELKINFISPVKDGDRIIHTYNPCISHLRDKRNAILSIRSIIRAANRRRFSKNYNNISY